VRKNVLRIPCILTLAILGTFPLHAQKRWWMEEPFRLVQTNLREIDATLDPQRLVREIADFPANTLLFGLGGIAAYYPTRVPFHYPSPHLPPGRDLFGEVLREAHARGIRVIGRFDLTKAQKPVYDAHPEWFFLKANGEPATYNGLYSSCINGGYFREHAMKILTEALDRYEVDGLFFNGIGNSSSDYSGNPLGLCRCVNCRSRFRARYGRELPATPDADYRQFLADASREVSKQIAELLHSKRPGAVLFNAFDARTSESNTAVDRPLPLWPYSASDNVNRVRNSNPEMMSFNLCIGFVDIPYRFVTVPQNEIRIRLFQNMAHGAGPAFVALGTLDQQDRTGIQAARPVFAWHAKHEDLYAGQESAARVLLLAGPQNSHRGFFRLLSERHIPFAVSDNLDWLKSGTRRFDLVISSQGAPAGLERYVREGGRLLAAGAAAPPFLPLKTVRRWDTTRSAYFRIRDHELLPSLRDTQLVFVDGAYLELEPVARPVLTLIPPSMFGPPEKVHIDWKDTDKPGLVLADHGKGRLAYLPWDVGGLYYRLSSTGHAGLIADLIDHLLPHGRQLRTNAHPLVEITVMRQPRRNRTLVHFVNLSGHSGTAYFAPVGMRDIDVELAGDFRRARSVRLGRELPTTRQGVYGRFRLPQLEQYDAVVLE
jgi:hypothetical protein